MELKQILKVSQRMPIQLLFQFAIQLLEEVLCRFRKVIQLKFKRMEGTAETTGQDNLCFWLNNNQMIIKDTHERSVSD